METNCATFPYMCPGNIEAVHAGQCHQGSNIIIYWVCKMFNNKTSFYFHAIERDSFLKGPLSVSNVYGIS
jgi:hypothetical protein